MIENNKNLSNIDNKYTLLNYLIYVNYNFTIANMIGLHMYPMLYNTSLLSVLF